MSAQFRSDSGLTFPGVSAETLKSLLVSLHDDYGLSYDQITEAASYSLAMVVRVALGFTAEGGKVAILCSDSLSGWVALAAARHLANAGTECPIVTVESGEGSEQYKRLLKPLQKMGLTFEHWSGKEQSESLSELFGSCHAIVCGLYNPLAAHDTPRDFVIDALNELQTPVHCVQAPLGLNVDTGQREGIPLFASSTLSLGAPLQGLFGGEEYAGRHYLCDISFTEQLYLESGCGTDLGPLFSAQPVLQIFTVKAEEEAEAAEGGG